MQQTVDGRLKILIIIIVILVVGGVTAGIINFRNDEQSENQGTAKIKTESQRYNFGDVSMATGIVSHNFSIENVGAENLKVSNISTSCMCTTAVLEVGDKKSPVFGMPGHGTNPAFWSESITPGETAELKVIFDPNAHGPDATGPITRIITIHTNSGGRDTRTKFIITGNVTK